MKSFKVYKLKKTAHILNVAELFLLSCIVLFYFFLIFFDETHDNWPAWLLAIVLFSFFDYRISKKVIKIKLSRNSLILCTRYGEKFFTFFELQYGWRVVENARNLCFVLRKNKQSFVVEERDFPEVSKIMYKIYRNSVYQTPKRNENNSDIVVYKPLNKSDGLLEVIIWSILVITWFSVLFFFEARFEIKVCIFLVGFFFLFLCYCNSKSILEIKWYKDKFILCTHYGEKIFFFDNAKPYKIEKYRNGIVCFVFKNEIQSFKVDERDFPEVVGKMKSIYCTDRKDSRRSEYLS